VVAADFQTFSKKEKKETCKTFDNAPGVLTITRVASKCRDTVGPAHLCHDAWLMSILNNVTKKDMRKCARGRGSLADLFFTHWVMPHRWFLGIVSPEIKDCALPTVSWVCRIFLLVAQLHRVDEHGWRVGLVPLIVSGVPRSLGGEGTEAFGMLRTIKGLGFKWSSSRAAAVSYAV
jgi:hypothetical protein